MKWRREDSLDGVCFVFVKVTQLESFVKKELQLFHQAGL